jgi:heme/copper-type cytochrome/quinol oxidase subunit 3
MTGFHGLHVTVGVIWNLVVMIAAMRRKIPQEKYMTVELAGLYWHFVDLVWVLLFTIVYLM